MASKEYDVHPTTIQDTEVLGDKAKMSHEEAMHFGELTPDELETEKHLRRKIDTLIMPMVVLVYLVSSFGGGQDLG